MMALLALGVLSEPFFFANGGFVKEKENFFFLLYFINDKRELIRIGIMTRHYGHVSSHDFLSNFL